MAGEEAIEPDEPLLRRIHRNNVDPKADFPVKRFEFEPKERDVDGASFYREKYVSAEALDRAGRRPGCYYIARLTALQLSSIGLTALPTPHLDTDIAGHVSIPELSFARWTADKRKSKELQLALAQLASANIILRPRE